jgi:hypothetical protein
MLWVVSFASREILILIIIPIFSPPTSLKHIVFFDSKFGSVPSIFYGLADNGSVRRTPRTSPVCSWDVGLGSCSSFVYLRPAKKCNAGKATGVKIKKYAGAAKPGCPPQT